MRSTFLIVETDSAVRGLLCDLVADMGHSAVAAGNLDEGFAHVRHTMPDVILAGVTLADGTWEDLLEEHRRNDGDAPIVLIGEVDDAKLRKGLPDDVLCCLNKPIERRQFENLTRLALSRRRSVRRERHRVEEISRIRSFVGAMLDTGSDAYFLLDMDNTVIKTNHAGASLVHMPEDEVAGKSYFSLLQGPMAQYQSEALEQVRLTGRPNRVETTVGGAVYSTVMRAVKDTERMLGFVIKTRDITPQRRSEAELAENEKRYRSVFTAARDAIIILDRNTGAVLDANAAALRLHHYSAEEMAELTFMDLSAAPEEALNAVRKGVGRIPLAHHRRSNGTVFPVEISMSHYMYNDQDVTTVHVRDISQRKVVEEALREGARLYRAVVEDQTELICRYTTDGVLTFVNGAFANFFAVDEDEVLGTCFLPHRAKNERRNLSSWLKEVGPSKPVLEREQWVNRADGETRCILWTNRAIFDHKGVVVEVQSVGRDETERKEAERALDDARSAMEQYRLNLEVTFRSIPDAIVSVDSELNVIASNKAAISLFGMTKRPEGTWAIEDVPSASGHSCVSVIKQVVSTRKPVRGFETEIDVPSKGVRTVELNCTPLIDKESRHTGAVLVVRDVSRIADLEKRLHERHGFRGIIGRSNPMQDVYRLLEQLSSLDSTVLILGESGTGKELVADALHYGGARAGAPFVKVNCSALSESLLESELFGHVRGAFTGAVRDKVGRIQAAQGGTIFLDEIGDISPLIQLKMLRFLEQKEYERVGESKTMTADVRIIAATNVDLMNAVRGGTFREDLYYRLNVMPVTLPPLRERQVDIPLLVEHFLNTFSEQFNKSFKAVSAEVMDLFMSYGWPGNIRELRHTLEHACILSPGGIVGIKHMRHDLLERIHANGVPPVTPPMVPPVAPPVMPYAGGMPMQPPTTQFSTMPERMPGRPGREDIMHALQRCGGNKAMAARELGIHRATLYRKLKAWGLDG